MKRTASSTVGGLEGSTGTPPIEALAAGPVPDVGLGGDGVSGAALGPQAIAEARSVVARRARKDAWGRMGPGE
jgi:hypothetical protein